MKPGTLPASQLPEDEIRIQHNGAVWIVSSHIDGAHHFEHLANAMKHANHLRDQHLGEERLRVILHRADSPLAK